MFQTAPLSFLQMEDFNWNTWTKSNGTNGRFHLELVDDFIGMRNYVVDQFDNVVYDEDVDTFGSEPDIDENGKIIILLMNIRDDDYHGVGNEYTAGYWRSNDSY